MFQIAMAAYQIGTAIQEGELMRRQGDLDRRLGEMNAEQAEIDAWNAEKDGYTEAARYQTVIDATIGAQRTAYAAGNVDVSYGTAAAMQDDARIAGQLNIVDIREAAHNKALGFKNQAANYRLGSYFKQMQSNMQASSTQAAGIARGIGTGVSGYLNSKSS